MYRREDDKICPVPRLVGRNVGRLRTHARIWEDGKRKGFIKMKEKQIKTLAYLEKLFIKSLLEFFIILCLSFPMPLF